MSASKVNPLDPNSNIAVAASAGTGKTYLLVNRIVSLLLHGTQPANILAITFTKKAANEMLQRVHSRLWQLHIADDETLTNLLAEEFHIENAASWLKQARGLYQNVLFAIPSLKITTFHAFCQDLLQNFTFEANVSPGFELTETTYLYIEEAWDKFFEELTTQSQHPLRKHIDVLFTQLDGLSNTREALLSGFLQQRLDWWSFTFGQAEPVDYAIAQAADFFQADNEDHAALFFSANHHKLKTFHEQIHQLTTRPYKNFNIALQHIANKEPLQQNDFHYLCKHFLSTKNEALNVKHTQALEKKVGDHAYTIVQLYSEIIESIFATQDKIKCQQSFALHQSWYHVGHALLENFQQIKKQRQVLDFNDLEWQSYLLLNTSNNAEWVQYKLDYRIEHFLIDEFQDTNPTQWQLLLPLLKELAAHTEQHKSVFIVGDKKQSIYRFRRANAELQTIATNWLIQHLAAEQVYLDSSWRSADAIMHAVNQVFDNQYLVENFNTHTTNKTDLIGHVEVMPLFSNAQQDADSIVFRNPLDTPPPTDNTQPNLAEARAIADKIATLIANQIQVGADMHTIGYDDILILFRNRTHANDFEWALSEKNIPFQGVDKGTLLDCAEVEDVLILLQFLQAPVDDLALAQLIKSPLFNGNDDDLILLASHKTTSWWATLTEMVASNHATPNLIYIEKTLARWIDYQHIRPVHDLLSIIYTEGDLLRRYTSAAQARNRARVEANLECLLEMALNVDSGRFPSIQRFLLHIEKLKSAATSERPDNPQTHALEQQVRLMTIHGAKGLEAPVVFLVDSNAPRKERYTYQPLIHWPAASNHVNAFFLVGKQADQPTCLHKLIEKDKEKQTREDNNLLYVAMTRAINMLFVSGTENSSKQLTWYQQLEDANITTETPAFLSDKSEQPLAADQSLSTSFETVFIDPKSHVSKSPETHKPFIQPSRFPSNITNTIQAGADSNKGTNKATVATIPSTTRATENAAEAARQRGLLIHQILYCLNENRAVSFPWPLAEYAKNKQQLNDCMAECQAMLEDNSLAFLFDESHYNTAHNELPIFCETEAGFIDGVIDRLVMSDDCIHIVDYKTHSNQNSAELLQIAQSYETQMHYYMQAVRKLYPAKPCKAYILFTANKTLVPIE